MEGKLPFLSKFSSVRKFRILYDDVGFSRLIYAIQNEKISPSALIQMLGDEMAIVR